MNIKIFQAIEGAKKATGLTVIIDIFRAFSVEAYCFAKEAEKIIPVSDSDIAYRLKEEISNSAFTFSLIWLYKIMIPFSKELHTDRSGFPSLINK